jgi:uncharacterized delta-60 repeat protein
MSNRIELLERRALLSGEIDTTFGAGGVVTTDFDRFSERFTAVTKDSAGRIYAAGSLGGKYLVAKFTPGGQLDTSFNNGTGYVQVPLDTAAGAEGIAIGNDGRIFLAGSKYTAPELLVGVVALKADGTLDPAFSGDGLWTGKWNGRANNWVTGLALVSDGRLAVGGSDGNQLGVIALNTATGELDTAFGAAGTGRVVISTDGATNPSATVGDFELVRGASAADELLLAVSSNAGPADGQAQRPRRAERELPPAAAVNTNAYYMSVTHVDADYDGRVYVGGAWQQRATVARLSVAGTVDTQFATNGLYTAPDADQFTVSGLGVLPNQQLLFTTPDATPDAGTTYSPFSTVTVLTDAGQPNRTYGSAGTFRAPMGNVTTSTRTSTARSSSPAAGTSATTSGTPSSSNSTPRRRRRRSPVTCSTTATATACRTSRTTARPASAWRRTSTPTATAGTTTAKPLRTPPMPSTASRTSPPGSTRWACTSTTASPTARPARRTTGCSPSTPRTAATSVGPFGVTATSTPFNYRASGYVYNDADGNGAFNSTAGDTMRSGRLVYVDATTTACSTRASGRRSRATTAPTSSRASPPARTRSASSFPPAARRRRRPATPAARSPSPATARPWT